MFSEEIKIQIAEAQNHFCAEIGCLEPIHSIHHKLHDTVANQVKFPLLINSVFNAVGLCFLGHKNHSHKFRITVKIAELFENFLRELKEEK